MSTILDKAAPAIAALSIPAVAVQIPPELEQSEGLVVRQARALVVLSDDDYEAGRSFLEDVILAGKRQVTALFDGSAQDPGPCKILHNAWQAMTRLRGRHLEPWETAEGAVRHVLGAYAVKREEERKAAEREAQRQAEELARQEAEAQAQALRDDAERKAEELRAKAAEVAETGAADPALLEQRAAEVVREAEETAAAIVAEPPAAMVPQSAAPKLKGVASTWKCDREEWDPVAFALWIAEAPKERAKYIGAPAWSILDAEAKAQKNRFHAGGIKAAPAASVRTRGGAK